MDEPTKNQVWELLGAGLDCPDRIPIAELVHRQGSCQVGPQRNRGTRFCMKGGNALTDGAGDSQDNGPSSRSSSEVTCRRPTRRGSRG